MTLDHLAIRRLLALYPVLASIDEQELKAVLTTEAQAATVSAGSELFAAGQACRAFPMVLSGSVRVARGSADGRKLELYRVGPGELCVVSTACLFGMVPLTAHGTAMQTAELVLLSPTGFARWTTNEAFRRYVFGLFADRMADLMALVEAVAFQRLDQRLAHSLLGHGPALHTTHQALADELGTVREIITRLLKRFEEAGWVSLSRERITLVDTQALRELSTGAVPPA